MGKFNCSTQIIWGDDIQKRIKKIQSKKIWIVCDGFLVDSLLLNELIDKLGLNNQIQIFSEIVPDPPLEKIIQGIEVYCQYFPDFVIAIGGGSAIDTAKTICYFVEKLNLDKANYFVAVPTTSGTGSEVTGVAVVTDTANNSKYPIVSERIVPNEAWLASKFVASCPANVVAHSGLDTLTHALESLVAKEGNAFTDALAQSAARTVFTHLFTCYQSNAPEEVLMNMHEASCMAGVSFQNSGLGICHAISHQLGGLFHLPHGLLNAMLLPHVIRSNSKELTCQKKYAAFSRSMGFVTDQDSDEKAIEELVKEIDKLKQKLNCDKTLKDFEINQEEFIQNLNLMVKRTKLDFTFSGNPRIPTDQEVASLILSIY